MRSALIVYMCLVTATTCAWAGPNRSLTLDRVSAVLSTQTWKWHQPNCELVSNMVATISTIASSPVSLFAGFDTHKNTHAVVASTHNGGAVEEFDFPTTTFAYHKMLARIQAHGKLTHVAIECTNNYGKTLADFFTNQGITVRK